MPIRPVRTVDTNRRWAETSDRHEDLYPVMSPADRQIEMLDRNTLDVLIGGSAAAGIPEENDR